MLKFLTFEKYSIFLKKTERTVLALFTYLPLQVHVFEGGSIVVIACCNTSFHFSFVLHFSLSRFHFHSINYAATIKLKLRFASLAARFLADTLRCYCESYG